MKSKIIGLCMILCAVFFSIYYFVPYFAEKDKMVETNLAIRAELDRQIEENKTVEVNEVVDEDPVSVDNGDVVAWIDVEACSIAYPVYLNTPVQGQEDYYLHHDENGNETKRGCIYTNGYPSSKMIIYGHNMNDGSMFGLLEGCVPGVSVKIQDMTMSDYKITEYNVLEQLYVSASDFYDIVDAYEADCVLVTCTNKVSNGRLLVMLEEK